MNGSIDEPQQLVDKERLLSPSSDEEGPPPPSTPPPWEGLGYSQGGLSRSDSPIVLEASGHVKSPSVVKKRVARPMKRPSPASRPRLPLNELIMIPNMSDDDADVNVISWLTESAHNGDDRLTLL